MVTPHDDPVHRAVEALFHSYEMFLEQCRRYQACCEEAEHLPCSAKRKTNLRRQREVLARWEALLHEEFAQADVMVRRGWKRQLRAWVAGLDEELSRLKRESN